MSFSPFGLVDLLRCMELNAGELMRLTIMYCCTVLYVYVCECVCWSTAEAGELTWSKTPSYFTPLQLYTACCLDLVKYSHICVLQINTGYDSSLLFAFQELIVLSKELCLSRNTKYHMYTPHCFLLFDIISDTQLCLMIKQQKPLTQGVCCFQ